MQRYREAGLNTNLLYGDFNSGLQMSGGTAASGPAASSSGSVGVGLPDTSGLGNLGTGLLQASKTAAEIQLMKSQAKNLDSDTQGKNIDNEFKPLILNGQIVLQGVQIELGREQKELTFEQRSEILFKCNLLSSQSELIAQQSSILFDEQLLRHDPTGERYIGNFNLDWMNSVYARWRREISEMQISETNAVCLYDLLLAQIANQWAQSEDATQRAVGLQIQNTFQQAIHSNNDDGKDPLVKITKENASYENNILRINSEDFWTVLFSGHLVQAASALGSALIKGPTNITNIH